MPWAWGLSMPARNAYCWRNASVVWRVRAGGLPRLRLLPRLEADDAGLLLGPGALRPVCTRRAVLPGKAGLPPHATRGIGVRVPGDALFAHGARHHLVVPVDPQRCLFEARARPGLPTGVVSDRADERHARGLLAVHQHLRIRLSFIHQVFGSN
jgi:hypothetical protein